MKVTDYALRCAAFDTHLRLGKRLVGIEVGVDAGAHAEAMLRHLDIDHLTLIDPWPDRYTLGFCEGRLSALGFRPRFRLLPEASERAYVEFEDLTLDFAYIDRQQDGETATRELAQWWPKLKKGAVFGYRNYSPSWPEMKHVLDTFVKVNHLTTQEHPGELVIWK